MMLYVTAAFTAYLVSGWNPAITLSKLIYKKDIRTCGSGNPGFTNFKRTFGNKYAWWVFVLDLLKSAAVTALFACLFEKYAFGAAYTCFFAVLGHAYPVWYGFKGGKGFLVGLSGVWIIDWRVGLTVTLIMATTLLLTKYMSLSTVFAMLTAPVFLLIFARSYDTVIMLAVTVLFIAFRHRGNFKRLKNGTESKFYFGHKK